ncbi:hypothetical protein [Pseudomonas sp. 25 R 14]|uniref:hypothetical protein n=1 Tax=Pseudomonas sp. 25 R 14 TaxID=1844109 RepID=UPI000812170A|nr:hypothetical protein [Pseudomonas sp. 25 R 14]CRM47031.1 hypothetical protein [Pseudomonas sp. 25 R 14]
MKKSKSTKNDKKENHEQAILDLAAPNLEGIYRAYTVCEIQKDKPDRAIILSRPHSKLIRGWLKESKVGIEITTADPREHLAYINDRKADREKIHTQIEEAISTRTAPKRPMKKIENLMRPNWIFEGIKDKANKYQTYVESGSFVELVLLCYSDIIATTNKIYLDGLKDWTEYFLSESNFPFDRVLFIGANNSCDQIYKKSHKRKTKPAAFKYEGCTIETSTSGMIPIEVTYKIEAARNAEAIIKPEQAVIDRGTSDPIHNSTE